MTEHEMRIILKLTEDTVYRRGKDGKQVDVRMIQLWQTSADAIWGENDVKL
jgi:hypothetical protein